MTRVAVIGSGAVGIYYGTALAAAGCSVGYLVRSGYDHVLARGFEIREDAGSKRFPSPEIHRSVEDLRGAEWVIVALKATASGRLEELLRPLDGEGVNFLCLQNGLGNEQELAAVVPRGGIFGGICHVRLSRIQPGLVVHSGTGFLEIGALLGGGLPHAARMVATFREGGIDAREVADLQAARWAKLVWNIAFNGLSILRGGVSVGDLLRDPATRDELLVLMREVVAVSTAQGYQLPADFAERQIEKSSSMGDYLTSSTLDWIAGRPVEFAAIWEIPWKAARASGVVTPAWDRLMEGLRLKVS